METSSSFICREVINDILPLILENNVCDIGCANPSEYFIPEKQFDHIWGHELLASKCYDDYAPAVEIKCTEPIKAKPIVEEEIEQLPYRGPDAEIVPLDKQLSIIRQDVDIRKKLANDFANRKYPWYIQRPTYLQDFQITDEMKKLFKNPFEYKILENLQQYKCHTMIIDIAVDVRLRYLECWLKFAPYAVIIPVIHNCKLYRKIKNFNKIFEPVFMDDNGEVNWQKVLDHSLAVGIEKAKELFLLDDVSSAIVFVFSSTRGICVYDEFKILKPS